MKPDFIEVQIPVLVSALDRPAFDRTQLCLFVYWFIYCSLISDIKIIINVSFTTAVTRLMSVKIYLFIHLFMYSFISQFISLYVLESYMSTTVFTSRRMAYTMHMHSAVYGLVSVCP